MNMSMQQVLNNKKTTLINNIEKLDILNPASVLLRGYSSTSSQGKIVTSINQVEIWDDIEVELNDGTLTAKVLNIKNK